MLTLIYTSTELYRQEDDELDRDFSHHVANFVLPNEKLLTANKRIAYQFNAQRKIAF